MKPLQSYRSKKRPDVINRPDRHAKKKPPPSPFAGSCRKRATQSWWVATAARTRSSRSAWPAATTSGCMRAAHPAPTWSSGWRRAPRYGRNRCWTRRPWRCSTVTCKSGQGEVLYTYRKHVRKPRGAKPGLVTVTQDKHLYIKLDLKRLQRLKESLR